MPLAPRPAAEGLLTPPAPRPRCAPAAACASREALAGQPLASRQALTSLRLVETTVWRAYALLFGGLWRRQSVRGAWSTKGQEAASSPVALPAARGLAFAVPGRKSDWSTIPVCAAAGMAACLRPLVASL
jgi:hypothetical protein